MNFIITAVPNYDDYQTAYQFEYWTDAVEYPLWERFYLTSFVKNPNGEQMMYAAMIFAGILVCIILTICVTGIRNFMNRNKVEPTLTPSGYV